VGAAAALQLPAAACWLPIASWLILMIAYLGIAAVARLTSALAIFISQLAEVSTCWCRPAGAGCFAAIGGQKRANTTHTFSGQ
jgi:hypothetical protein